MGLRPRIVPERGAARAEAGSATLPHDRAHVAAWVCARGPNLLADRAPRETVCAQGLMRCALVPMREHADQRRCCMLNRQGRPTAAGEAQVRRGRDLQRQPRAGHRGAADLRGRAHRHDRRRSAGAGQVRRAARQADAHRAARAAGSVGARGDAPLRAAEPEELRHRHGPVSARLVHHEAQPAPQREDGAAAGLRRCASAAAALHGAGRDCADRRAVALALRADRHAGHRHDAQGRRARRAVRADGHQGGDRGARREALGGAGAGVGARHQPGDGGAAGLSRRDGAGARRRQRRSGGGERSGCRRTWRRSC